jgi:hypothetical protein
MLYRGEIVSNRGVKVAQNFSATHPKQVIRRLTRDIRGSSLEFLQIYVLNEDGQAWIYQLRQIPGGIYHLTSIQREEKYIPKHVLNNVFAGNMTIREAIQ